MCKEDDWLAYRYRFQKACVAYGVPDVDLFQTVDLWDRKNIAQVTMTIFAIGRTVSTKQEHFVRDCFHPVGFSITKQTVL